MKTLDDILHSGKEARMQELIHEILHMTEKDELSVAVQALMASACVASKIFIAGHGNDCQDCVVMRNCKLFVETMEPYLMDGKQPK